MDDFIVRCNVGTHKFDGNWECISFIHDDVNMLPVEVQNAL